MRTECSAKPSEFARVDGRPVVADFDGGALTSDAGGLLLGAADRVIDLVGRLAGCFRDARDPRYIEHSVSTLIGQRVYGIALGYEDLVDHDELRHDPLMAVLAGKLWPPPDWREIVQPDASPLRQPKRRQPKTHRSPDTFPEPTAQNAPRRVSPALHNQCVIHQQT